jgi:hypothetical protein
MAVDQPRQQGVAGQVDDLGALGQRVALLEQGLDPLAPDQHHPALAGLAGLDVHHPVAPQGHRPLASRHPGLLRLPYRAPS